jgi:hypothetical protein
MASLNHGASEWFIVKRNWPGIMQDYLGLGGDCYPGTEAAGGNLCKKILDCRTYMNYEGIVICVLADFVLAKEYFAHMEQKQPNPLIISVSNIEKGDVDGYDFGNPEGGYSIIESEILARREKKLIDKYLNEKYLFKDIHLMRGFLASIKGSEGNVEEMEDMDSYREVSVKQL